MSDQIHIGQLWWKQYRAFREFILLVDFDSERQEVTFVSYTLHGVYPIETETCDVRFLQNGWQRLDASASGASAPATITMGHARRLF